MSKASKRIDKEKYHARLSLIRPYLIDLFQVALDKGWFEENNFIKTSNHSLNSIPDWNKFPFLDFYNFYANYLKTMERFRVESLCNPIMYVKHHITPKFEGGLDSYENMVFCHRYQHSIFHLVRWHYTNSPRDLGGFSSNAQLPEVYERQKQARQENPPTSPNPPPRTPDRKKPTTTAQLFISGQKAGLTYQFVNNRRRVNPFLWFVETLEIEFQHKDGAVFLHSGFIDYLDKNMTASDMARELNKVQPNAINNPQSLKKILTGEDNTCGGWKVNKVILANQPFKIRELKVTFDRLKKKSESLGDLKPEEMYSLLSSESFFLPIEIPIAQDILNFLCFHRDFMNQELPE